MVLVTGVKVDFQTFMAERETKALCVGFAHLVLMLDNCSAGKAVTNGPLYTLDRYYRIILPVRKTKYR